MNDQVRTNASEVQPPACSGDILMFFRATFDCSSPSGCVLVENNHTLVVSSKTVASPMHITLRQRTALFQDGRTLLDQDITPVAEIVEPNGHECGPTCHVAEVGLQVDAP